ncbi:MAG: ATP-binding protein [Firmicutes bacterium]|nr:ATP-binding protein [Bacillota bacterium]
MDPKNPGAVDEIIHLGDYWDLDKMEANKKEILEINTEVGKLFKRAYKYLGAARPILESIIERNTEAMDFGKVNVETYKLINEIFKDIPVSKNAGKIRHLFGSAYTPNGWVEYTDSVLEDAKNVYYINGDAGTGKTTLFTKVFNEAIASGFDVEVYHTPLIPERIETIYIPKLKIGLTSSEIFRRNNYKTLNLNGLLDQNKISKYKDQIDFDKRIFVELIDRGIQNISMAKKKHDLMEQYYVPNMDFAKVENLRENLIKRVLRYEENSGE